MNRDRMLNRGPDSYFRFAWRTTHRNKKCMLDRKQKFYQQNINDFESVDL